MTQGLSFTSETDDLFVGTDRFALETELADGAVGTLIEAYDPESENVGIQGRTRGYHAAVKKRERFLELINSGSSIEDCCVAVNVSRHTYKSWRARFTRWAAAVDVRRAAALAAGKATGEFDGTPAQFIAEYFHMNMQWFQLLMIQELEAMPLGNILMVLLPPEHGKTTTFENYANWKLAMDPSYRFLVTSENQGIAKKILGRVMNRMDPMGPTPAYVARFGPFTPQTGAQNGSQLRQPWNEAHFRVYAARLSDERNFSMEAVGANGSIVSARTDHLHIDDIQSTKTLGQTDKIATWMRQDAFSRPAESGKISIAGTRVGDDDVYESLLNDTDLDGIMKVIRFPAVITDHATGVQKPLDESRHTLESLDRMRRKVGSDVWDRNWMQSPGLSKKGKGTFERDALEKCSSIHYDLTQFPGHQDSTEAHAKPIVYIGLDPALGGRNCIIAVEVHPERKLIVRRIREDIGFERNEQIMSALESVVTWCSMTADVTDVVIEDKNFQLGLKNDDRMKELAEKYGFNISGHTTGWDKYDADIGVASMSSSFIKGEFVIPWGDDDNTRHVMGEFKRQLLAWKPGVRGTKLRQDQVMALWFVWMKWRSRWKSLDGVGSNQQGGWKRQTTSWQMSQSGLVLPKGA